MLYLIRDTELDLLLYAESKDDWESVFSITHEDIKADLDTLFDADGLLHYQLRVHRASEDWRVSSINAISNPHLNIFEFDPARFQFEAAFETDFKLTTASQLGKKKELAFCINANYFDENDKPLGAVIHQGKQANRNFPNWTGFFFVKNGKPYFGPKSLLEQTAGQASELLQCYPSIMKDHRVFDYVHLKSNPYFDGNSKTYRSLAGMRKNGHIIWIASAAGGILDVRELASLAQKLELQHATLFDGGSSLQYRLAYRGHHLSFHALSERFSLAPIIPQLDIVHPPVYLGVKAN
ncbi:MAG: phosphodiester glycosidase family protein [Bacteroidota bacterium]